MAAPGILPVDGQPPIELDELLAYLDAELDATSEESILACAPKLTALANNRRFLAEFLARDLASEHFQERNTYTGAVFVLGTGRNYMVRAVGWSPRAQRQHTPSGGQLDVYDAAHRLVHSHSFALITIGYWGPGYETDFYECNPDAIRAQGQRIGEKVDLKYVGRYRLGPGTVLYYPAHRVAHLQHPPEEYSISLNLLVKSNEDELLDQFYFDCADNVITGAQGTSNDTWGYLLNLASDFEDPALTSHLTRIAATHANPRVRQEASRSLTRHRQGR